VKRDGGGMRLGEWEGKGTAVLKGKKIPPTMKIKFFLSQSYEKGGLETAHWGIGRDSGATHRTHKRWASVFGTKKTWMTWLLSASP